MKNSLREQIIYTRKHSMLTIDEIRKVYPNLSRPKIGRMVRGIPAGSALEKAPEKSRSKPTEKKRKNLAKFRNKDKELAEALLTRENRKWYEWGIEQGYVYDVIAFINEVIEQYFKEFAYPIVRSGLSIKKATARIAFIMEKLDKVLKPEN